MKLDFKKSLIVLAIIIAIGGFLRFYKLGNQSFIADEYLGINISYGYAQSGQWKNWNFNREELTNEKYTRAQVYYWQVAQVLKFFSPTEANSRLVSVLWGILGIILVFFAVYYFTRKPVLALLCSLFLAVSISALIYDRKLRMYSMLAPVYFAFALSFYQFLESKYQGSIKWLKKVSEETQLNWLFFLPMITLGFLSLQTHLITVNIFPTVLVFIIILAIYKFIKEKSLKNNKYLWILLLVGAATAAMFKTHYFKDAMVFFSFVDHWGYLEKVTLDYSYILLAGLFFATGGYYLIKYYKKLGLWIVLAFFVPLILAIFAWDRNEGDQYIYFVQIFKVVIFSSGVYFIAKKIAEKGVIPIEKNKALYLVSAGLFLLSINIPYFFSTESFYYDIRKWKHSNYREIFKYYLDHRRINDAIITRDFSSYYIRNSYSNIMDYGDGRELTLDEIKEAQEKYKRIWAVYSKDTYIEGDARKYIEKEFDLIKTPYTNKKVDIWLWSKEEK